MANCNKVKIFKEGHKIFQNVQILMAETYKKVKKICILLDVQHTNNGKECKNKCQKHGETCMIAD